MIIIISETNVSLISEALEAFNSHDLDGFMEFYDESAFHYQPTQIEPLRGRKTIKEDFEKSTFTPFPDAKIIKKNAFGRGDWICLELIFEGTNTGPLLGPDGDLMPPTNKSVSIPLCFVIKLREGKMIEVHEYNDQLSLLSQLGLT